MGGDREDTFSKLHWQFMIENIDSQTKKMILNIFLKLKRAIISPKSKSYTGL